MGLSTCRIFWATTAARGDVGWIQKSMKPALGQSHSKLFLYINPRGLEKLATIWVVFFPQLAARLKKKKKKKEIVSNWLLLCSVTGPWCENASISVMYTHLVQTTAGGPDQVYEKRTESWSAGDKCLFVMAKLDLPWKQKQIISLMVSSVCKQQGMIFYFTETLSKSAQCFLSRIARCLILI